jgi:hypothetical protein
MLRAIGGRGFRHIVGEWLTKTKGLWSRGGAASCETVLLLAVALPCITDGASAPSPLDWYYAPKSQFNIRP